MADTVHVKGLAQLDAFLTQLPGKIQRNVMRGALRAGANVMRDHARANAAKASGLLAKGVKVSTGSKGGVVYSYVRTTGAHKYLANWIEFGTAAHRIVGRNGGMLRINGGAIVRSVEHPGSRAIPFMRPALDTQNGAAVVATGNYIKARLATKHGMDTASIEVEEKE